MGAGPVDSIGFVENPLLTIIDNRIRDLATHESVQKRSGCAPRRMRRAVRAYRRRLIANPEIRTPARDVALLHAAARRRYHPIPMMRMNRP